MFLLEDCAQCAGGSIDGKKVGTFGDMAIFSFQMNKNMTSGEGGCVVTNDERLYNRAVACHDTGYARDSDGRALFDDLDLCLWGRGYRMDEIRASILRVQLKKLPKVIAHMHDSKYRIRQRSGDISRASSAQDCRPGRRYRIASCSPRSAPETASGSIARYVQRESSPWPRA